ncbi:MAG: transglutaminase domain-containing protein [Asgard group archaeon]|nr:transglutaminase domain-containing protein [Asgard group archaeon]
MSKKQTTGKSAKPKKQIFTRENISKVFLPSLFLIAIIMTPVLFEAFNVRHQRINDVVDAPFPADWYDDIFNNAPNQTIDPDDPDQNYTDGFLDGFTNGVSDPERILFRITPTDEYFYWRLEVYDEYLTDNWDKNSTTEPYTGYTPPTTRDGEFTVTSDLAYYGGTLARYFPAPYHYIYNEEFSENFAFDPAINWDSENSHLEEDMYGSKLISALFENTNDNTTLTYDVSYTIQDNNYIKDNTLGYSSLNSLIISNPVLNDRYLQIPEDYNLLAPYTYAVANELRNPILTIYDQIYKNMIWLTSNCSYDIDMLLGLSDESPAPGEDYVEWFLSRQMGTAAHFSSALSMISRIQGIPTRTVVGFSYGELSGSEFIIRAKHIHSWTEVFLPISGTSGRWVAFDPSPLLPGIRDQYGVNTIGTQTVFYCSNEFFLSSEHMNKQLFYPYFVPNPTSSAWYSNPYNPSEWYGPYVNRTQTFKIYAYLGDGTDTDFFTYLLTGDPGALEPITGETISFIDTTTDTVLGSASTNSSGYAEITYSYPLSAQSGKHYISAEWLGIQIPTYDLRYIPLSYINTGVIVSSTVNITSTMPYQEIFDIDVNFFNQEITTDNYSFTALTIFLGERQILFSYSKENYFFI